MLSHIEAQELHELIGAALEEVNDVVPASVLVGNLQRARELAAIIVSDTEHAPQILLIDAPGDEYGPPVPFGPFLGVEAAQDFAEDFREANGLPREATPENNDRWTDAGWYFGIFEPRTKVEKWPTGDTPGDVRAWWD